MPQDNTGKFTTKMMMTKIEYPMANKSKKTKLLYPECLKFEDFKLLLTEIFSFQCYLPGLKRMMTVENPICVDLGANIGLSVLYFENVPSCKIYAVEPNPMNVMCLKENTKQYSNIQYFDYGIRAYDGDAQLLRTDADERYENMYMSDGKSAINCKCKTIKSFMEEAKIDHIDVLKIDIEGGEYELFMSDEFREMESKIDFIVGECHFTPLTPLVLKPMLKNYDVNFINSEIGIKEIIKANYGGKNLEFNFMYNDNIFTARRKR
jgi:FkbM family methyltransferase